MIGHCIGATLAEQLVHALSPAPILLIDASPSQRLTRTTSELSQARSELLKSPN